MRNGYKIALERIRHCQESKATTLDLGNLGLDTVPEEVWELEQLEVLNLGASFFDEEQQIWEVENYYSPLSINKIKFIPNSIRKLNKLKELYLCGTIIKDFLFFKNLPQLEKLDLTWVSDFTAQTGESSYIQLIERKPYIDDFSFFSFLPDLRHLDISGQKCKSIKDVNVLKNLTYLNINGNQITHIENSMNLPKLTKLIMGNNEISSLKNIDKFPYLEFLDISYTEIQDISELSGMLNLEELDLANAKTGNLLPIKKLLQLRACKKLRFSQYEINVSD